MNSKPEFYVEFYGAFEMLVSTIRKHLGKMVGRPRLERGTNWLKAISIKHINQRLTLKRFTEKRPVTPFRINNLHVGFTEFLSLKTLHPQSCVHNSEAPDLYGFMGVLL